MMSLIWSQPLHHLISTQTKAEVMIFYGSSAVRAFHPMAYPQSLGRWRVTGFSSSVGSQFSVISLLTSPRRNIGNDHLASANASSQRNSIHPQAMLVADPRNINPMEWLPLGAEVHSLKKLSHRFFTTSIWSTKSKRLWSVHWRLYLFYLSTHLCAAEFLL